MRIPRLATIWLMALTGLVSIGVLLIGSVNDSATGMGFIPARFGGLDISPAVPALLTPLSATLLHAGIFHLVFNFILFAYCGIQVERVLGAGALVLLYAIGAYVAAFAQYALEPGSVVPVIGASGAISALVGAYALSFGQPKRLVTSLRLNRWLNIAWLLLAWIALQWAVGYLAGQQGLLLATGAHIGGFVAGIALQRPLLLWRYRGA